MNARGLSYRRQVFDRASLRLVEQPERLAIYDMSLKNNDDSFATGRIEWDARMPDHACDSVRFLFRGRLPLAVGARLGGDDVVAALADVAVGKPAGATVTGRYHGPASATPDREQLEVRVDSKGPFTAWKIPGEDFSGTVLIDGRRIQVQDARLRYAGGEGAVDARIHRLPDGYRLTFDATFDKCDRTAFFDGLAKLKGDVKPAVAGEKPAETKVPAPRADISGNLRARIRLPDPATLDGAGHFVTEDPALFKLPLFGVFSRGLEKMGIDAGIYRFDSADGDLVIRDGAVYFPALTIRERTPKWTRPGTTRSPPKKLFFRAVLNPKAPDKIPLLDWALAVANRTTRLFPVDIRGTLDKPEWSVDPTPTAIFKTQHDDGLGLPPAPPVDDGNW